MGVDPDLRPSVLQRALDGLKGGLFVRTELFILSRAQVVVGTDLVVSGADDGALTRDVTGVPTVLSECLFVTNQRLGCEDGCRWTPLHPHTPRGLVLKVCLHTFIDQHETSLHEIASWCEESIVISILIEACILSTEWTLNRCDLLCREEVPPEPIAMGCLRTHSEASSSVEPEVVGLLPRWALSHRHWFGRRWEQPIPTATRCLVAELFCRSSAALVLEVVDDGSCWELLVGVSWLPNLGSTSCHRAIADRPRARARGGGAMSSLFSWISRTGRSQRSASRPGAASPLGRASLMPLRAS